MNEAPIYRITKNKTLCETSTFGNDFFAMYQTVGNVFGLHYKIMMFGMSCEEPTFAYGDSQYVLANTIVISSTLKKKSNSISFQIVREGCTSDEWRTTYEITHENPADIMTKPLPSEDIRWRFLRRFFYFI